MKYLLAFLSLAMVIPEPGITGQELVVYSARKEHLIKPIFDAYRQKTGIKIKYITDKAGPLLTRIKAEGKNTPADLLLTVDAGNLWHAAEQGVLLPVNSEKLIQSIPEHLRDPDNHWFGLSVRARTIIYNPDAVSPDKLSTYEDLADKSWRKKLCLRTSKKVYNQSLIAMMIHRHGEAKTQKIVEGWIENLAMPPFSNDTMVLEAVAAGKCDVGIVNTYYFGRLLKEKPDLPLRIFWPNQGDSGTGVHINISGAGVTRHAPHREQAITFLEWLASTEAQAMFGSLNMEYPANTSVQPDKTTAAWGTFNPDTQNLATAGKRQAAAVMLMDRAGYK